MAVACPVCGTQIPEGNENLEFTYHGKNFKFCTLECMKIFQMFPDAYGDDTSPDVQLLEDLALQ
jgi:YHS domain-containing protein